MNKILFQNKNEFNRHKNKAKNKSLFSSYFIVPPTKFPCVGLEVYPDYSEGYGTSYKMEDYVYLEDFE